MYFWTKSEIAVGSSVFNIEANSGLLSGLITCVSDGVAVSDVLEDDWEELDEGVVELEEVLEELEEDLLSTEEELEFFFVFLSFFCVESLVSFFSDFSSLNVW